MKPSKLVPWCIGIIAMAHSISAQTKIDYAEYYLNADPGPGNGTEIVLPAPPDTAINLSVEIPKETIAALDDGFHKLIVRTRDDEGDWSVAFVRVFVKGADTVPPPTPDIVAAEYFFDTDPGPGNGTSITLPNPPTSSFDLRVDIAKERIADLEIGFHKLVVRALDSEGDWSVAFTGVFQRQAPPSQETIDPKVARIDYQWLVDGEEVGSTVSLTPETPKKIIEFTPTAELGGLDGVTAVLRVTPFDIAGNQGWPAFRTVVIEWLDEENGGVGDGFPDQWEALYDELDPTVVNDKGKDSDEDGLTDFDEFLAGTDPGNSDTDGDGVSDSSELLLVDYGFDPAENNADLLVNLQNAAFGAGLYSTEFQLRDLNLSAPIIAQDPLAGKLYLKLRIQESSTLGATDWKQLPVGSEDITTTGGDIKITIPDLGDDNLYFFRIFTDENFQ